MVYICNCENIISGFTKMVPYFIINRVIYVTRQVELIYTRTYVIYLTFIKYNKFYYKNLPMTNCSSSIGENRAPITICHLIPFWAEVVTSFQVLAWASASPTNNVNNIHIELK